MERLYQAIRLREEADCRSFLDQGLDVNASYRRSTAVTLAAEVGFWPVWRLMLDHPDFRPEAADQLGATPLWHAARSGQLNVAQSLLDRGAQVDRPDLRDVTPLNAAGYYDAADVAALLIRHGADVNVADTHGFTPLRRAASNLSVNVVDVLLRHGADVNHRVVVKEAAVATPLLETLRPDSLLPGRKEREATLRIMRLLISGGADLDAVDGAGDTALHRAVIYGQIEPANLLVASGCQLERRNLRMRTPLHEALARGQLGLAKLLVVHGSDASAPCSSLAQEDNPDGLPLLAALFSPEGEFPLPALLPHLLIAADVTGRKGAYVLEGLAVSARLEGDSKQWALDAVVKARGRGLTLTCVRAIRRLLAAHSVRGRCLLDKVDCLPIPNSLKRLLTTDLESQGQSPFAACPLHSTPARGHAASSPQLQETSVDPDASVDSETSLTAAVLHRRSKTQDVGDSSNARHDDPTGVLDLPVRGETSVNAVTEVDSTSLHATASTGRWNVVDRLLESGSDVIAEIDDGKTATNVTADVTTEETQLDQALN